MAVKARSSIKLFAVALLAILCSCGHPERHVDSDKAPVASARDPVTAMPDDSKSEVVPLRQETMRRIEVNMNAMSRIVLDSARPETTREVLLAHVKAVEDLAKDLPGLFPQGSRAPSSRAKLEVWTDSESFKAAAAALRAKVERFVEVARSGDSAQIKAAYRELNISQTCNECHMAFRRDSNSSPESRRPKKPER